MNDNINILVKLFETLKHSSDKNEEVTQTLIIQQLELVSHIKHLPIEDLRSALREHATDSKKNFNDVSNNIELKSINILRGLSNINNKVSRMILVVVVAFTVVTSGYFLIKYAAERGQVLSYEKFKIEQNEILDKRFKKLMNDMGKEMDKRHIVKEEEN